MKFITKLFIFIFVSGLAGSSLFAHENEKSSSVKKAQPKQSSHADHNPKHGGQFFMAPNKFHHLEGVMISATEFRIYVYDDHTKPIPATPFKEGSKVQAQRVGADGREAGPLVELPVAVDPSGSFLSASVPGKLTLPLYFTTWLTFPGQKEPDLFNFTFDKVSVSAQGDHSKTPPNSTLYQCPMKDSPPQDKPGKCPKCGMNLERKALGE